MGVKILFFSRGALGQNSMFPEKWGQNSIFFPSALKKGGQNRGAYQPTSLKGCPPPQRRADVGSRLQAAQSALQRGLRQCTQSVSASSLDRRQGDPHQMAEIRKLRVNLQLLKSK